MNLLKKAIKGYIREVINCKSYLTNKQLFLMTFFLALKNAF